MTEEILNLCNVEICEYCRLNLANGTADFTRAGNRDEIEMK